MCGKQAVCIFNGFSLCSYHHFSQLWKQKEQSLIDGIIDKPDYEERMKDLGKQVPGLRKQMMLEYASMFGEKNGKDNYKRR